LASTALPFGIGRILAFMRTYYRGAARVHS
jgi:hypothetical protein